MYSVLQLQQVWSNKPEEQDLTPATSPIHDVLPAVQEEETEDDNGVAVTSMCIYILCVVLIAYAHVDWYANDPSLSYQQSRTSQLLERRRTKRRIMWHMMERKHLSVAKRISPLPTNKWTSMNPASTILSVIAKCRQVRLPLLTLAASWHHNHYLLWQGQLLLENKIHLYQRHLFHLKRVDLHKFKTSWLLNVEASLVGSSALFQHHLPTKDKSSDIFIMLY